LTLNKACFNETRADDRKERHVDRGRTTAEQSDHRKPTLLRRAASGHATAAPPSAANNFRRSM